ncbi:MAG: polymerase subunit sigma-24 [Verrucomicrobia bacterium]|nr:polymerase subunit sigma-24 [Verrucomicrobiota bacterium]
MSLEGGSSNVRFFPNLLATEDAQEAWFDSTLKPHVSKLRAYLVVKYPAAPDLDDIVQESLIRTLKAAAAQTIRNPCSYLFRTARNMAIDALRHVYSSPFADVSYAMAAAVPDLVRGPIEIAETKFAAELIHRALALLPPQQRTAIKLRRLEGLSYHEVAARMGISTSTVDAHCYHGMKKLADMVRREVAGLPMVDPTKRRRRPVADVHGRVG